MKIKLLKGMKSLRNILSIILFVWSILLLSCTKEENKSGSEPNNSVPTAKQVVKEMAAGFNLGNTFDNGLNSSDPEKNKKIIDLYHNAGMKHVRIPVTWMERFDVNLADADGNIDYQHSRFLDLVALIDYAIALDMYVVINAHHEHWLKDYYDGSAGYHDKFSNLWTGIANYFKEYDYHLIFEVLNEPDGMLGEWGGDFPNPNTTQSLNYTRTVNEIGYNAIRAAGGNNETRVVMVSTNALGNSSMLDEVYPDKASLPGEGNDPYVAIQVHSYDPWEFCGQDGSNTKYPGNSSVQGAIHAIVKHAEVIDVPLNYGEFGVGRRTNTSERNTDLVRGYYRTFSQKILLEEMSFSVWDDRGWFGLIAEDTEGNFSFVYDIVPTMLAP